MPTADDQYPEDPEAEGDQLSEAHEAFVSEYLLDQNAAQAYLRAFGRHYRKGGQWVKRKYDSVCTSAWRLLSSEKVQACLARARRERAKVFRATDKKMALELGYAAFADIGECFDEEDRVLPIRRINATTRRAIERITREKRTETTKDGREVVIEKVTVELVSKLGALAALAKHTGFNVEPGPLDQVLNALPPKLRDALRKAIREEYGGENATVEVGLPCTGKAASVSEDCGGTVVPDDGVETGCMATAIFDDAPPKISEALLPPIGGERDQRGEGIGVLFE